MSEAAAQRPSGVERSIPGPLPGHPGNIYLEDETVAVSVPGGLPAEVGAWRLIDIHGRTVRQGALTPAVRAAQERLGLGEPGIGHYRVEFLDANQEVRAWTQAAVLARLRAPTPWDSPICLDLATAWFARDDTNGQRVFANLAALAGVNVVRDRLRWRDMQPEADVWAGPTTYDSAAQIQHEAGLEVLQVFHDTPSWAGAPGRGGGRFAPDLRHVYGLGRALAARFRGRVQAWEPWNEANVRTFGGHTVNEMCSWQKAAWLGFKAGDSNLMVGWNPTAAVPTAQHTRGVLANETWPYFDTYNIHTYDWAHGYLELWEPAREAAAGRPLWITESDRGSQHLGNDPWYDLSRRDEILKAQYMAQSYAQSLFAGASRHFHFILGHYHEPNGVQFGLLRKDTTPRPAYVALAALGRFLAGARVLGSWRPSQDVHAFAFRGDPDGQQRDVLVAWAEKDVDWSDRNKTVADWVVPPGLPVQRIYDFLGRDLGTSLPPQLSSAPLFVVLPIGATEQLPLERPPTSAFRAGQAIPVVLQVIPTDAARVRVEDKPWSEGYAYGFRFGQAIDLDLFGYNFSDAPVTGRLSIAEWPVGWKGTLSRSDLVLAPGQRERVGLTFLTEDLGGGEGTRDGWVVVRGNFGWACDAVVAFRMVQHEGVGTLNR